MREQKWGRVVNIASVYSTLALNNDLYGDSLPSADEQGLGPTRQPAYHSSKGALLTLTRDLAVAVANWGITVNAVSPGMFMTEQTDRLVSPDVRKKLESMTPMRRFGEPNEVAYAVRFLVSEEASFITGIDLRVDGGWSIW
jgi:3-oxoacyl-[acyl-carrier protein] reductase